MSNEEECVSVRDLIRSAQYGRLVEVEALVVRYGLDVNELDSESNFTALQVACFNGHAGVVKFLIDNGADVHKRGGSLRFWQWSAIHFASTRGHRDVVEMLISCGATVDDRGPEDKQPIHFACENGHGELAEFLLAKGASVHSVDENGFSPLFWACLYGHHNLVVTLLSNGARVDYRALSGSRPITVASSGGHNNIVLTLIAHGADVNDFDFPRVCPLYSASRMGRVEVVRTLLAHGAQIKNVDFNQWNPLHPACAGGHYEVVEILLGQGIPTESHDNKGLTPVQNVCNGICKSNFVQRHRMSNKAYTLKMLFEYGLDPRAPDKDGLTTFQRIRKDEWALYNFDHDMLALLLDYGVGSGESCPVEGCYCNTTSLRCLYLFFRMLFIVSEDARETATPLIDEFERYFIKARLIGIALSHEKAVEPPEKELDWVQSRREAYLADCIAELSRTKISTIGKSNATFFNLLIRDLPALRHQKLLGQLDSDDCAQRFPIYGKMIFSSYIRLLRLFLIEESPAFFTIFSPMLLPECAEIVLNFLSTKDLKNVVQVYCDYQIYLEKLTQ